MLGNPARECLAVVTAPVFADPPALITQPEGVKPPRFRKSIMYWAKPSAQSERAH